MMDLPGRPETGPSSEPSPAPPDHGAGARVWAIAGGKGGVGRSLVAANLGIQLARSGQRVVLVDLDPQGGNLHGYLGFSRLTRSLRDLASGRLKRLDDLVVDTAIGHLRLIGGLQNGMLQGDPVAFMQRVGHQARSLPADIVVLDCGSGRSPETIEAFSLATLGILVTTPEPAALESVCLFAEAHLHACLRRALPGGKRAAVEDKLRREGLDLERLPFRALMSRLASVQPPAREAIARVVRRTRMELLLNQVRGDSDEEAAVALASGFRKCFGLHLPIAGMVEHDPSVLQSVRKRRPLAQQHPNTSASKEIARTASRLLATAGGSAPETGDEWEDLDSIDHYRVLEIVPKASSKEVQSAYQTLKKAYDPETTCLAPLLDTRDLRDTLARIEASYRTLIFVESRVAYDRELLESGVLRADDLRGLHLDPNALQGRGRPAATPPRAEMEQVVPPLELAGSGPAPRIRHPRPPSPAAGSRPPAGPGSSAGPGPSAGPGEETAGIAIPSTGAGLREERLRRNQTLEEISRRTKIRSSYLEFIEAERFAALPAAVYLRGFIKEYALCLGLPGDEVAQRYIKRYREWQQSHGAPPGPAGAATG